MDNYNHLLVAQAISRAEPLTLEGNLKLLSRVLLGDQAARQQMIEGNIALVIHKVNTYLHFFPKFEFLRDDLTSAGLLGLVRAVNKIAQTPLFRGNRDGGPIEYMSVTIIREIGLRAESESIIHIPRESRRRAKLNGKPIQKPRVVNIDFDTVFSTTNDEIEAVDMRDLIEVCCQCDEERVYVRMREKGYKLKGIAEAINMPLSSTHVLKEELYSRVLAKAELKDVRK
jgi:hypothetical protein